MQKPRHCSYRRPGHSGAPFQGPRTERAQSLQQLPHVNHFVPDLVQSGAPHNNTPVLPEHKTVLDLWTCEGGNASSNQNIPLRRVRSTSRQRCERSEQLDVAAVGHTVRGAVMVLAATAAGTRRSAKMLRCNAG